MSAITRRLREENDVLRKRVLELEAAYNALIVVRIEELATAILTARGVARKPP
jgi:hypothetical protein